MRPYIQSLAIQAASTGDLKPMSRAVENARYRIADALRMGWHTLAQSWTQDLDALEISMDELRRTETV